MTNSDRYSPDDYNAEQIDEDTVVEHQGTVKAKSKKAKSGTMSKKRGKTKSVADKRKPKVSPPGTAVARAKRTDSDQNKQTAGAKATVNSVSAKKPTAKKSAKKTATNRVGKAALSKETTMKAMAKQELVANSAAKHKALKGMSSKGVPLKKGAEAAGTGIVWTLLGIGLAACGGGTSYVDRPVTKEVPGGNVAGDRTADPAELAKARNELRDAQETLSETQKALANVLGNTGQVSKGLPRGAKIYLLDKDGNRVPLLDSDGNQIVTDVNGQFDISNLTPAQRIQLINNGYEADLTGSVDAMTGEVYTGGSVRSLSGQSAAFSSPLTTLLASVDSSAQQDVLDLLFPDSGITINDILTHLNYRLVPEAMMDGFDAKSNAIEKIAIRVMATLERFVSEDSTPDRSTAVKASEAIKKLVGEINKVVANNKDSTKTKQTVDNVVGLKSESEVQHQIEQAETYGGGRPSAAPVNLSMDEDTSREISLIDLGFSDSETDEEIGAITFTSLSLLGSGANRGTLTFVAAENGISYGGTTYNTGDIVTVSENQKITAAWVRGGVFTFTPGADQSGDAQLTYQVEAKKKGQTYNADSPVDSGDGKSASATMTVTVNPVNDRPTDTALSGVAVLKAIQGVITAKTGLDNATNDAGLTTAQAALQKALDVLIDLNIGGRSEVSQADKEKVADFIAATKALIEVADHATYSGSASTAKKQAFTNLVREIEALKVAEVYRVVDGAVDTGGGLTPADVEKTGLNLLMANNDNNDGNNDLNSRKKALDDLAKPKSLAESNAALTAFETFFTALSAVKAATNLGYMDDLAAKADAVLAALDTTYDSTGLADERAAVTTALNGDGSDAVKGAKAFFSDTAGGTANTAIMKLLVDVDDAFAMLKSADATNIVARLKAFVDALGKLDAGDGNAAQSVAVITAATTLLNELFDPAHTNTARADYTTALQTLIDTQTNVNEATPPFTIGGTDGGLFKAVLVKTANGADRIADTVLDNVYQWQLVLTGAAKPVGATYEITVTYTDADGGSYQETYVLVQDVSRKGFHLEKTDSSTAEYSGQHDVLNPNAGGPTLAEGRDRAAGREADNDVADNDSTNNFSFTGGLPQGGSMEADGDIAGVPQADASLPYRQPVTLTLAQPAAADSDAPAAVMAVNGRVITITFKLGASADDVKAALDAYMQAKNPDAPDAALDPVRDALREILNVDGLSFLTPVDGGVGHSVIGGNNPNLLFFGVQLRVIQKTDIDAWNNLLTGESPPRLLALEQRALSVGDRPSKTVTLDGGTITKADGTEFAFEGAALVVAQDEGGDGTIGADEIRAKTVYVYRSSDGTTIELRIADSAGIDLAALATGGEVFVIGTIARDGTYSPNMAAPTTSWTVHDDALKNSEPEDFDTTVAPNTDPDTMLSRVHEYELAPNSDTNNNDAFHLAARAVQPGDGVATPSPQTLTHVGRRTPDYEGADPTRTVELTRKTIETRLHEANFNGFKGVQVDGADNSGDDDATNDATFSYAATGGGDADNLITVSVTPAAAPDPVTFVFAHTGGNGTDPVVSINGREITVTFAADADVAGVFTYLNGAFKENTDVAALVDIAKLSFVSEIDAEINNANAVAATDADGNVVITITSPGDTLPNLKTALDKAAIDEEFTKLTLQQPTIAEQVYNIDAGVIYLPAITKDGTVLSTDVRITFAAKTFTNFTFTDDDVTPENMATLAAARTAADFVAKLTAIRGAGQTYTNLVQGAKDLLDALETAWIAFGTRGENRADLQTAIENLKAVDTDDEVTTPAEAARAFAGVPELIAAVEVVLGTVADMGTVADERVAVTIYVSQDEDGTWSAKAIATADIGDLAGTTYYVIGTVDANGEPAMNTQGGTDEGGSVLTYTVTTPMPGTIKHVINTRNVDDNGAVFQAENGFRAPNDQDAADARKNVGAADAFTGRHLVQKDGDATNKGAGNTDSFAYDASLIDFTQTPLTLTGTVAGGDLTLVIEIGGGKLYSGDGKTENTIADTDVMMNHAILDALAVGDHKFKLVADRSDNTVKSIADNAVLTADQFVLATFTITRSDNGTDQDPNDDTFTATITLNKTGEKVATPGQRKVAQDMTSEPAADFVIKGTDANTEINEQVTGTAAQKSFTLVATDADNVAGRNPNARLPIATKTEIITYELTADTANIDNEYASIDRNSGVLTFNAGVFDYENKNLREDAGGKYFLIQVKATSTSSLTNARAPQATTKTFKIYVQPANEAPTDLRISDGIELADLVTAVNDAYQTLIDNDDNADDGTAATADGTIAARLDKLTNALTALKNAYDNGDVAAKAVLLQGVSAADYNALVTAAQALLDHINAEVTAGTPATPAEKLTALNIAADENNDITPLKLAFTNAVTGMQGREARLTIEAGYEDNPVRLALGTIKVTDSDVGDTHEFTIGGALADLFTVETDEGTGIHTLVYTGGTAGLSRLADFIGGRFTLPITVSDARGETHTVNFSVVYETAFVTTPRLATVADGDGNGPDIAAPVVAPETLKSGETKAQNEPVVQGGTPVPQTIGGLFETANGSVTPIVIGAVSLAGVPLSKIKDVTVTNPDGTPNTDYEVKQGKVDANGTFTADATTGQWWLLYKGTAAPDYEVQQTAANLVLNFDIDGGRPVTGFTGQTGVQADGDDGNADARTFSYSGGAVTVDASRAAVGNQVARAESVTNGAIVSITIDGADHNILIVVDATNAETTGAFARENGDAQNVSFRVVVHGNAATIADFMTAFNKNGAGLTFLGVNPSGADAAGTRTSVQNALVENTHYTAAVEQQVGTPAELTVTVAAVTFYTASGDPVNILGATLTSATPGEQFVFAVKEGGTWVLKLGQKPASGEFYVLTNGLTPGTTATTATSTELANTTGGTAVNDGTVNLPTQVKLPYVVPLKNLDDAAPAFDQADDGVTLASAPQNFKLATGSDPVKDQLVLAGTMSLPAVGDPTDGGKAALNITIVIADADAAETLTAATASDPATITVTLAANARTVQDLFDALAAAPQAVKEAFITYFGLRNAADDGALAHGDLDVEGIAKVLLGVKEDDSVAANVGDTPATATPRILESGTHYDKFARDTNGNKIVENSTPVGEPVTNSDDAPPAEVAGTSPSGASVPNVEKTNYIGEAYKGVSTGLIVQGATDKDGDTIVYRLKPIDSNNPDANDNALVTLAVVGDKLTIVFKTGGPDFESVRGTRKDGNYVFVVEAASKSELGDDSADRSSRAGEQKVTQTYHYKVTDSDEAPWNVQISSRGIQDNQDINGVSVGAIGTLSATNDRTLDEDGTVRGASGSPDQEAISYTITGVTLDGREVVNWQEVFALDVTTDVLTWTGGNVGVRVVMLAGRNEGDANESYTLLRGDTFRMTFSVADADDATKATQAVFEIVNGTVTLATQARDETNAEAQPADTTQAEAIAAFRTYEALDDADKTVAAQKTLLDALGTHTGPNSVPSVDANSGAFSGARLVVEDATAETFIGILKSTSDAAHFWLVKHGDSHINSRFEIREYTLDQDGNNGGETTTFYALFLKAGKDVRNFEADYVHDLDIGYGSAKPDDMGNEDNFSGWQFVDADGTAGGARFAFTKATWDGIVQPDADTNAPTAVYTAPEAEVEDDPNTPEDEAAAEVVESLLITIHHNGGKFYHAGQENGHDSASGTAATATLTLTAADLADAGFDEVGETLTLYLVHNHGDNTIALVKAVGAGQYRFAEVIVTRGDNDADGNPTFTVTSITRATGEFVNGGQVKNIADGATVGSETYQVRPVNVNEAPDNLRILEQTIGENGQPTSQIALDWANAATDGNTPPSAITFDLNGTAGGAGDDGNTANDLITGLKDGAIWTFDANGVGTPTYFQAPVNGQLQLPAGAATLYISEDADGIWRIKVIDTAHINKARDAATNPGLGAGADPEANPAIKHHILGTISAPNAGGGNARSFTHTAQVASATATVTESSDSADLQSVVLTAAHLRAVDEDTGDGAANIVYIITGYQDANYHQDNSRTADDDRNVKMGWVERFDGTNWVKLDVGDGASETARSFTQADVNAGLVRFTSSGADATKMEKPNTATFKYVVRDNRDTEAERKISPEQTATVNITPVNDAPMVDNVKSHSFTFTNGGTNYTIKVVGDAANAAAVKSVVDGTTIEIHVQGGESVDEILAALYKTANGSHGAQIDGLLGLANPAAVIAADDPNVNTDLIDGIRAAMRALDGNAPQKTATDAERTFAENVPQTTVDIDPSAAVNGIVPGNDARQGGITLTHKMFGIVDVDTPADQVKIKLDMANIDQRQLLKRDYTAQTNSEVTREADTGLPSAGEVLLKSSDGKAGRILVKTASTNAATDWKILVATPTDGTELEAWQTDHFTLKQLQDGHVVFLHEISHEEAKIILRLLSITDGTDTTTFTPPASDAPQSEKDAFAETAEVELTVTEENDAPIATGTNSVPLNELIEGDNLLLDTDLMGAEDYDKTDGSAEIRYVITDLFGLTVDGRIQAVLERKVGGNWRIVEIGSGDASFTLADLAAGNIRLRHLGEHAVGNKGTLTFGYTIDDDADGAGRDTNTVPIAKTATIVITPENDRPSNISTDKNSIKVQGAAEDASGYEKVALTFRLENIVPAEFSEFEEAFEELIKANAGNFDEKKGIFDTKYNALPASTLKTAAQAVVNAGGTHAAFHNDNLLAEKALLWQEIYNQVKGDDEEKGEAGVATTYEFYFVTDDSAFGDHVYFTLDKDTGVMRFKTREEIVVNQGLQLKGEGEEYKVKIRVVDTSTPASSAEEEVTGRFPVVGDPDTPNADNVFEQTFQFAVRNFDYDWDYTGTADIDYDDRPKAVEYQADDYAPENGKQTGKQKVGEFTVVLEKGYAFFSGDNFTAINPVDVPWGTITVEKSTERGEGNKFIVYFTPKPNHPDLIALAKGGEKHIEDYSIKVNVEPAGVLDKVTGKQVVYTTNVLVKVTFAGVNEAPSVDIPPVSKILDYHGQVQEAWTEAELTAAAEAANARKQGTTVEAEKALIVAQRTTEEIAEGTWNFKDDDTGAQITALFVGTTDVEDQSTNTRVVDNVSSNDSDRSRGFDIDGTYGTLTLYEDGTWKYTADATKTQQIRAGETKDDKFYLWVVDEYVRSVSSELVIKINGTNDRPTLTFTPDINHATTGQPQRESDETSYTAVRHGSINIISTTKADEFVLQEDQKSEDGRVENDNNSVTGKWNVTDADNYDRDATKLTILVNGNNKITLPDNQDVNVPAKAAPAGIDPDVPADTPGGTVLDDSNAAELGRYTANYGDIIFYKNGTWKYVLTHEADKIAKDEVVTETLNIRIQDEDGGGSATKTIKIKVVGSNDTPHGISTRTHVENAPMVAGVSLVETVLDSLGEMRITMGTASLADDITIRADGTLVLSNKISYGASAGGTETLPDGVARPAYVAFNGGKLTLTDITSNKLMGLAGDVADPKFTLVREANGEVKITFQSTTDINGDGTVDANDMVTIVVRAPTAEVDTNGPDGRPNGGDDVARQGVIIGNVLEAGARYRDNGTMRDETDPSAASANKALDGVSTVRGTFDGMDVDLVDTDVGTAAADWHTFVIKDSDRIADTGGGDTKAQKVAKLDAFIAVAKKAIERDNSFDIDLAVDQSVTVDDVAITESYNDAQTAAAAVAGLSANLLQYITAIDALVKALDAAQARWAAANGLQAGDIAARDKVGRLRDEANEYNRLKTLINARITAFEAYLAVLATDADADGLLALVPANVRAGDTSPNPDRQSNNPLKDADVKTVKKGVYGWLYLNKHSGEWEYVLDNADIDTRELDGARAAQNNHFQNVPAREADVVYDIFTIIVTDEEGAAVEKLVRVRITGENDAPVLSATVTNAGAGGNLNKIDVAIKERGGTENQTAATDGNAPDGTPLPGPTASGRFGVFDIDGLDRSYLTNAGADTTSGTSYAINSNYRFDFEIASRVSDANRTADETVSTSTGDLGTDNATVINSDLEWTPTEAGEATAALNGKFGRLIVDQSGTWNYYLFGEHASTVLGQNGVTAAMISRVEKLAEREVRHEHFAIRVKDEGGAASNIIYLDITITGTNDAPTLQALARVNAAEGGFDDAATPNAIAASNVNGRFVLGDVDAEHDATSLFKNDDFTVGIRHKTAIDNTGGAGELVETAYTSAIIIDDDNTRVTEAQSTNSASPHSGKREGMQFTSLALTHGTLYIWDDKTWMFVVNQEHADVNGLNHGQIMTKTVEITITDDREASVTRELVITITGANDKPASLDIPGLNTDDNNVGSDRQLVEDGGINNRAGGDSVADGTLSFTDIDKEHDASKLWANQDFNIELRHKTEIQGAVETAWSAASRGDGNADGTADNAVTTLTTGTTGATPSGVHAGKTVNMLFRAYDVGHGTLYIYDGDRSAGRDNSWRFVLNQDHAEVQGLNDGQTMTKTFGLTVIDSKNGKTSEVEFKITITGDNDAPVLTIPSDQLVSQKIVNHPAPQPRVETAYLKNFYGPLVVTDHDAEHKVGSLKPDGSRKTFSDIFTIFAKSGSKKAETTNGEGNPNVVDTTIAERAAVDFEAMESSEYKLQGLFGTLSITGTNPDSWDTGAGLHYMYHVNRDDADVRALDRDEEITEKFLIRVSDGRDYSAVREITVTIVGLNDIPVVTVAKTRDAIEHGERNHYGRSATGTFTVADPDGNDKYGGTTGKTFDDVNTLMAMSASKRTGSNDSNGNPALTDKTDAEQRVWTDYTRVVDGTTWIFGIYGGLQMDAAAGTWQYLAFTSDTGLAARLDQGETVTEKFVFYVHDGEAASSLNYITVTLEGKNDAPELVADNTTTGDVDANDTGVSGKFAFTDQDGSHTFTSLSHTVNEGVTDGDVRKYLLNNVFAIQAASASRKTGSLDSSGNPEIVDVADADLQTVYITKDGSHVSGLFGYLKYSPDLQAWTYTLEPDAETRKLDAGETLVEKFALRVHDGSHWSAIQRVEITIHGVNDAPVIESIDNGTGTEGVNNALAAHINGRITITDVDGDDDPSNLFDNGFSVKASVASSTTGTALAGGSDGDKGTGTSGTVVANPAVGSLHDGKARMDYRSYDMTHGTLYIYQDGSYRFDIKDDNAEVNGLAAGQTITKTISLVVNDGNADSAPQTFTITINGADDDGVLSATSSTKNSWALDQNEVLASFEITDVDTDYSTAGNAGLISRTGTDSARFTHEVARKAGAGNENIYVVTVKWAANQRPSFNEDVGADNRYEVTVNITGAPDYDLTVDVQASTPEFVDDKGNGDASDDTVITTATVSRGETLADGQEIYTANARQAGETALNTNNIRYAFVTSSGTATTIVVEGVTFAIDTATGQITKTGGSFANQDTNSPDSSLDLTIRATDSVRNKSSDMVLTVNITNEDEPATKLTVAAVASKATRTTQSSDVNVEIDETFDDAGWTKIGGLSFNDPDNPAKGENTASIISVTKTVTGENNGQPQNLTEQQIADMFRVNGTSNELQIQNINVKGSQTDVKYTVTLGATSSGIELPEATFTVAVDGVPTDPAKVRTSLQVADRSSLSSLETRFLDAADATIDMSQARVFVVDSGHLDWLDTNHPTWGGAHKSLGYTGTVANYDSVKNVAIRYNDKDVLWAVKYTKFKIALDDQDAWSQLITLDTNTSNSNLTDLVLTFDNKTGQNTMNGHNLVTDIFTVDTTAGTRAEADVITKFEDGRDKVKIAANDGAVAANGNNNTVSWKSVADTTDPTKKDITIYVGNAEDANKILAVIEDFDGTFDENDFETLAGVTFAEIQ